MHDSIVLITGANRGIGRALADRFAEAGATCILTVRSDAAAASLQTEFARFGDRVVIERVDLGDEATIHALRDRIEARFQRVDVLINNAAIFVNGDRETTAEHLPTDIVRETLEINLIGTIAMCTAFASLVPRGGRIINVSSTMGQFDDDGLTPYATAYSVSKVALNGYTSSLANALADRGILVDALHPGWVQTEMGGPGAQITPVAATETVYYLATRPPGPTGKFWFEKAVIPW